MKIKLENNNNGYGYKYMENQLYILVTKKSQEAPFKLYIEGEFIMVAMKIEYVILSIEHFYKEKKLEVTLVMEVEC